VATPTYSCTCLRKTLIAQGVYELEFSKPAELQFFPGQFLLVKTPLVDNPADIQVRAYSVASLASDPTLLFVIKVVPGGRMGRFLEEKLEVGTTLDMQGPFGVFKVDADPSLDLVFVATGTGLAPFRPQVRSLLSASDSRKIDIVYGVRDATDLFWVDWLKGIESDRVHVHIALTRPSGEWAGFVGRVQTILPQCVTTWSSVALHVCGNPAMITDLKVLALNEWKIPKNRWHAEAYI
jgi:NAD(P)H-flavin reductase